MQFLVTIISPLEDPSHADILETDTANHRLQPAGT
jgi:hypothetical protein